MGKQALTPQEQYQQTVFDERAQGVDDWVLTFGGRDNRNMAIKIGELDRLLALEDGDKILEVGVGSGIMAKRLLDNHAGVHITGIDISGALVDKTREKLSEYSDRCTMQQDNANDLSFADGTFDKLYCSGTLHHMEEPGKTVREMTRVLRPGGRLVLMEPNWLYPSNIGFMIALKEDRNMFLMRRGNFRRWMEEAGLNDCEVGNLLYTPPRPTALIPLFDAVDRAAGAIPGIRRVSLMVTGTGVKA